MPFIPANVEEQYKKDPNLKKEDVEILKEWLQKQPHLPKITDLQVQMFLNSCHNRIEPAKITIDNYFTVRTLCPEIFACPSPEVIKQTFDVGFFRILPKKTPEGHIVLLTKLLDIRPENYVHLNQIKLTDMVTLLYLNETGICNGYRVVIDMHGSVFGHMTRCNLGAMKKHLYYLQEAIPLRIKGVHMINLSSFVDALMNMIKPLISKELHEMIHFHSTIDTLHPHVPKEVMPKDYGGGERSIKELHDENVAHLLDCLDFFKMQDSQVVDESKRVSSKSQSLDAICGAAGTFKKLSVD